MGNGIHSYPALKPSGIPWLGDVPAHWEVRRIGTVARILNGATPSTSNGSYWDGDITWITPDDLGKLNGRYIVWSSRRITEQGYRSCGTSLAPSGTIAISTRAPIGHLGILRSDACVNQGCRLLVPDTAVEPEYMHYALSATTPTLATFGQGSTFTELSRDKLASFSLPLPPLSEQRAIVRYLDYVDERIRRYITARQKLIDLLEEEKQAIINHAVTRGLDPNVRLKPSGVDWLGDVPEHWQVSTLKWYSHCHSGDGLSSNDVSPEIVAPRCIPVIGGNGLMGFAETENCVGPVLAIGRVGALCGNVHMIEGSAWITDNALVLSTYSDSVPIKYLAIILKARNLNDTANKTAQPLITGTGVLNERIPIPPKSEQDAIVNHLDMSTTDIEATIARARRQIELLQEYRTRLIADVVTGKLDVRDAAAQLPYEDDDGQDPMIEESDLPPGVMSADPQDPAARSFVEA